MAATNKKKLIQNAKKVMQVEYAGFYGVSNEVAVFESLHTVISLSVVVLSCLALV